MRKHTHNKRKEREREFGSLDLNMDTTNCSMYIMNDLHQQDYKKGECRGQLHMGGRKEKSHLERPTSRIKEINGTKEEEKFNILKKLKIQGQKMELDVDVAIMLPLSFATPV